MTAVLVVQAVLFQDGGLIALGANVLNMGVIGSALAYVFYSAVGRWLGGLRGALAGAVIAAWFGVLLGAVACTFELAASGVYPLAPALGAMVLVHSIIGLGEALVTGLALGYILRTRPDLIYSVRREPSLAGRLSEVLLVGASLAVFMAVCVSPFASELPDGMEWTMERLGVPPDSLDALLPAPLPDYSVPGLAGLRVAGSIAGAIGVVAVFALAYLVARTACPRPVPDQHVGGSR
jgi:cobalt/nickel transport system permease protein